MGNKNKGRHVGYPAREVAMRVKRDIPVHVVIPEDQYIDYADAFAINYSEEEFIITFLQLQYPVTVTQEQLDSIKSAETLCIARIALTPRRMETFAQAIQANLKNFAEDLAAKQQAAATSEASEREKE
ncbi:MAG TPA: DUF3467 domain-containing protein [Pyrinomonadaceae bacterium]